MKKFIYYLILVSVFLLIWLLVSSLMALFFKSAPGGIVMFFMVATVWGVLKYVRPVIRNLMHIEELENHVENIEEVHFDENAKIEVGDIIIDLKSCKEFRVKDVVGDNEFECMERYGGVFYTFKRDEIKLVSKQ